MTSSLRSRSAISLVFCLLVLALALILRHAWVSDDAFITFRSVEQLFAGNGPRWNPHERVQVFTHPLWFFLLSFGRLFNSNLFIVALVLGAVCSLGCVFLLFSSTDRTIWGAILALSLLASSKAWVDFSTSGLENPLYGLLLLLALILATRLTDSEDSSLVFPINAVIGLLALTRHDSVTLTLPILIWVNVYAVRSEGFLKASRCILLAFSPFLLWSCFSLFYYGFPFPNTAYAKLTLDVPSSVLYQKGAFYFYDSLMRDPATLLVIVLGLVLCFVHSSPIRFCLVIGILLNCFYILRIGGDFMSGRFLTPAFTVGAFLCAQSLTALPRRVVVVCLLGAVFVFNNPFHAQQRKGRTYAPGIVNEKAHYWKMTSLSACLRRAKRDATPCPRPLAGVQNMPWRPVRKDTNIGRRGYFSRLDQIWVDIHALSDPLLARLPARKNQIRAGHIKRQIPAGYIESLESGENKIKDPALREYYRVLRLIVSGPLFSMERLRAVGEFNLGRYSYLLKKPGVRSRRK